MMQFCQYARYYDLIYKNKPYQKEINFIESLIHKYDLLGGKNICDIGCGTGKHADLLEKAGYDVTGVEVSEKMLELASNRCSNRIRFLNAGIQDFKSSKDFDVCISLFHVLSYLTTNNELTSAFENVSSNLRSGGLFIFDFWFYDGVHHLKPEDRVHEFEGADLKVKKIVKSDWCPNEKLVVVDYRMEVKFGDSVLQTIEETHKMRYFKVEEIKNLAKRAGFQVLEFTNFYDGEEINDTRWAIGCIVRKM